MAFSRFFRFCAAAFCWYLEPRRLLHGPHAATRLSIEESPPASSSIRWSAVVAAAVPHQWHSGFDANSACRLFLYFAVSYSRVMSGVPLWRGRPLLARAPRGACCQVYCRRGFAVPPRSFGLSPWWPDVRQQWTVTIRVCVVRTPHGCFLGMPLYPRSRVLPVPCDRG